MRQWFKKWEKVIVWTLAIAFIVGIAFWSVGTYLSSRSRSADSNKDDIIGYLQVKDQEIIKDKDLYVARWQLEQEYQNLLAIYGWQGIDMLFTEPAQKAALLEDMLRNNVIVYYAKQEKLLPSSKEVSSKLAEYKKQIEGNESFLNYVKTYYGSVDNYLNKIIKSDVWKNLVFDKVIEKVAKVSDEEMKSFFEQNLSDLKAKYDKVDVEVIGFENETSAKNFLKKAREVGFDKAATEMSLQIQSLPGLQRGIFEKDHEELIFSAKEGDVVGPIPLGSLMYVFKINKSSIITDFESFKTSDSYSTELNSVQQEKLQKWYESYVAENEIKLIIKDEIYDIWAKINKASSFEELAEIYRVLSGKLFGEDQLLLASAADILKSAFLTVLEKMRTLTNSEDQINALGPVKDQEKMVVENLYQLYPSSIRVVRAMYNLNRDNIDVKHNYFSLLYSEVKPYLQPAYTQYLLQTVLELEVGFESIARNEKAPKEYRTTAYYNLYDLTKSLGDKTSAKFYLEELKKLDPNYIDFDTALKELEGGQ